MSVVLADDHPLYREGVAGAIKQRPDLQLLGEASDGGQALALVREHLPQVALIDLKMETDGLTVLRVIRDEKLPTRVVILSAYLESAVVYKALEDGATAFISKRSDRDAICDAVMAAARGETRLSPDIQDELAKQIRLQRQARHGVLTKRQRDILMLAAEGLSTAEIGSRLHLSPATIKTHLAHIYEKLEVRDRTAAVAEALRRRLLD